MGYEKISHIALCINRIKPLLSYAQKYMNSNYVFYEHEGVYGFMIWNCLYMYILHLLYILLFILSVTSSYYELMLLYL